MRIRHILCPVDFSSFSAHALQVGIRLARIFGAHLSVLHIREFDPASETRLMEFVEEHNQGALADISRHIEVGHAAYASIDFARDNAVDVILCGSHGRTGVERALLGSVAEKLVRHAKCPVWVMRGDEDKIPPLSILIATDLTPTSQSARRMAIYLAVGFGCKLAILHVVPQPDEHEGEEALSAFYDAARAEAEAGLSSIDSEETLVITREVAVGKPWEAIVARAKALDTGLIVTGTHGRTGLDRWVLGSVADKVVRNAHCPVLTVPHLPGA